MTSLDNCLQPPHATIQEVIQSLEAGVAKIALVVDPDQRLLGTVTDGDIRRGILRNISLDAPVEEIMNSHPMVMLASEDRSHIFAAMRDGDHRHMPLVDKDGRVVDIESLVALLRAQEKENWVVLMAGGTGRRLLPLTEDRPKPLLTVGDKPILETILDNFVAAGFRRFYISINYKGEMIESYFGDGKARGIEIRYLREDQALGTAGALSLLPEALKNPILVMSGDILTNIDFEHLLEFHTTHNAAATMCVRAYDFQIPYGVVEIDGHRVIGIAEKPVHQFFINAGIYVLEPETLASIPVNSPFDMPALLEKLIEDGRPTITFPVREQWLDIGRQDDFSLAQSAITDMFK